jgi:glycerol kinase
MVLWSDLSGVETSRNLREAGFPSWPQAPACKLNALLQRCGDGDFLWGGLDSYLVYRLSGGAAHVTDLSNAWMTGCFDPEAGGWNRALLDHLHLPEEKFPCIVDSWGAVASASALGAQTPIAAIVGDQQAGLFAHAALGEGGWKATLGTSGVVMASTGQTPRRPHPTMPPEAVARGGGRTIYGVEGMVITAGSAVDWMCGRLGLFESPAALFEAAATGEPGVVLRPSLSGLGAPYASFDAQGLIGGLHPGAGRAELARALMEGLAFRLREICATIAANIPVEQTLGVDGGLSGSEIFLQHLADCLGRPVRRLAAREGSAMGAALAAALGTGLLDLADLSSRARYDRTFEPRTAADESDAAYAAWSEAVNPGGVSRP